MRVKLLGLALACGVVASSGWGLAGEPFAVPFYTTLGCEGPNLNAVIVDCEGWPSHDSRDQIACTITGVQVVKQDAATSQKNRVEFLAAAARQTETEKQAQIAHACEALTKEPGIDFSKVSPSVRLTRDQALQYMKTICGCKGRESECLTRAILPSLDADERACTVHISKWSQGIFKQVDKNRWMYTATWLPRTIPPVEAFAGEVLENDPQYPGLWTYKANEIKQVCSWKQPVAALLNCEEVNLR